MKLVNKGLWNKKDELDMHYTKDGSDDGFLDPDTNSVGIAESIPVDTLSNYLNELEINNIDFLKIEAEGAEPEIIQGMGEFRPQHVVVNVDEERESKSTDREVMKLLQSIGYSLVAVKMGHILFFTLDVNGPTVFQSLFEEL